jgi:MFS family permease
VKSPLASPRLRRIIAAYTVNRLGTWIGTVALSVGVYDHTRSALAVAATLIAAQAIPAFLVPALVAKVEASSRRSELSLLYVFEAAATAALAVLLWHFWLPGVLLLVALDGTAALAASALLRTQAARVAREELPPPSGLAAVDQAAQDELGHAAERKVNAVVNIAFSGTFVVGPVVGGAIAASAGASAALLVDSVSFLACGALLLDMHPHVDEAGGESVRARLLAAWKHINAVPALRTLLLAQAVALVFFESTPPIEVAYAKTTLHVGDRGFGLLVTVWGIGVAVGSVLFARSARRSLRLMVSSGTLAVGVAYLGFAVAPSLLVACAAALVGGVGNGVQWAPLISAVQRLTPASLHGRVMGALESIGALAPALGLSLGGALVALSSPRLAFLVVGLGAALTTIGFLRLPLGAESSATVAGTGALGAEAAAEHNAAPRTAAAGDSAR